MDDHDVLRKQVSEDASRRLRQTRFPVIIYVNEIHITPFPIRGCVHALTCFQNVFIAVFCLCYPPRHRYKPLRRVLVFYNFCHTRLELANIFISH